MALSTESEAVAPWTISPRPGKGKVMENGVPHYGMERSGALA